MGAAGRGGRAMTTLGVRVDGEALPGEEAIAFWKRFSAWMDAHPGDLAGFAAQEKLASVHPEMQDGAPVLVASRTAAQRPYASAPTARGPSSEKPASGSRDIHGPGGKSGARGARAAAPGKNRGR